MTKWRRKFKSKEHNFKRAAAQTGCRLPPTCLYCGYKIRKEEDCVINAWIQTSSTKSQQWDEATSLTSLGHFVSRWKNMLDFSAQLKLDAALKVLNVRREALGNDDAPGWQRGQIQIAPLADIASDSHDGHCSGSLDVPTQVVVEHVGRGLRALYGRDRGPASEEDSRSYSVEASSSEGGRSPGRNGDTNQLSGENMISPSNDETAHSASTLEATHGEGSRMVCGVI